MPRRYRVQRVAAALLLVLVVTVAARQLRGLRFGERCDVRIEHRASGPRGLEPHVEIVATAYRQDVLFDRSFRVRPGGRLVVDLTSEDVVIRTTNSDEARVRVDGRGRDAEREFERRRFSADASGDRLIVRTDPPRQRMRFGRTDARYTVTIEIPRRFSAALDLGSGDIQVGQLQGDLVIDLGSGDVSVGDVDGDRIAIETGSGDVVGRALRGEVVVESGSGDVQIDRVDGRLSVETGSGDVEVGEVTGPIAIDTGSGDVSLALRTAERGSVSTGSGDVSVGIARHAGFDVALSGGGIRIDRGLDFSGRNARRSASGRINGGGPRLEVSTGSGDVRLNAR